jgi:hypothetical protein
VNFERSWRALELRISPLEGIVQAFAASLTRPKRYEECSDRGFRFEAPDVRHFCLLKAARVVSALNAAVHLARGGYVQEVGVLSRTIIECTTHIEYVLDMDNSDEHEAAVKAYIEAFLRRHSAAEIVRAQVPQGKVHATIGKTLDEIAVQYGDIKERKPSATLYSHVYRLLSNYVHAKYPECMDMYGGTPGKFHLQGMSGTPKDNENLEQIAAMIDTASNAFVIMIRQLSLRDLVSKTQTLDAWYKERLERD